MDVNSFKKRFVGKFRTPKISDIEIKIDNKNNINLKTDKRKRIKEVWVNNKKYKRDSSLRDLDDSRKIAIGSLYSFEALASLYVGYEAKKAGEFLKNKIQDYNELFSIFRKDFHNVFESNEISTLENIEYFIKHEKFSENDKKTIKNFISNYHQYNKMEIKIDRIKSFIDKGYMTLAEKVAKPIQEKIDVKSHSTYKLFSYGDKILTQLKNKNQINQEQQNKIIQHTNDLFKDTGKLEQKINQDLQKYYNGEPISKDSLIYEMNLFNMAQSQINHYLGDSLKVLKEKQDSLDIILKQNQETIQEINYKVDEIMNRQSKLDYLPMATGLVGVIVAYLVLDKITKPIRNLFKKGDYAKFD